MTTAKETRVKAKEEKIREALLEILGAADDTNDDTNYPNDPAGGAEGAGLQGHNGHNENRQGAILLGWEKLAFLTDNGDLADEHGFRPGPARMAEITGPPVPELPPAAALRLAGPSTLVRASVAAPTGLTVLVPAPAAEPVWKEEVRAQPLLNGRDWAEVQAGDLHTTWGARTGSRTSSRRWGWPSTTWAAPFSST